MITWGAFPYVKRTINNYKSTFGVEVTNKEIHPRLDPSDQPELDVSELCDANEVKIH